MFNICNDICSYSTCPLLFKHVNQEDDQSFLNDVESMITQSHICINQNRPESQPYWKHCVVKIGYFQVKSLQSLQVEVSQFIVKLCSSETGMRLKMWKFFGKLYFHNGHNLLIKIKKGNEKVEKSNKKDKKVKQRKGQPPSIIDTTFS